MLNRCGAYLIDWRRGALACLPGAEQEPGQAGPRGRLPRCEVSLSSESSRYCPKVASRLKGLRFGAQGPL